MKKNYLKLLVATALLIGLQATAQMSGPYTVPGSFSTLAAAISSLNVVGASGAVIIQVAADYTETAPAGGYVLTATGTNTSSIMFVKDGVGANPLLSAFVGTATPSSAVQDGIFTLVGSDYVSIIGIDLVDNNTTNPATMEYGYGFYKASATDGCQHNTIVNCAITLNRNNNATGIFPALDGSRGIDLVNAIPSANTTSLTVTSSDGSNSYNSFYTNTIQNCNYGIVINGFPDVAPFDFSDKGNAMSSNSIINYGGGVSATNPAAAVSASAQQTITITGNTFNNNDGSGVNHIGNLYGVKINIGDASANFINGNKFGLHGGGTASQLTLVDLSGASNITGNVIEVNGNTVRGCSYTTATSGNFYGFYNSANSSTLSVNGNTFATNSTASSSGAYYNIYNSGDISSSSIIAGNTIDTVDFTASSVSSTVRHIYSTGNGGSSASSGIYANTFKHINFLGTGTGFYSCIYTTNNVGTTSISGNAMADLSLNTTGTIYLIYSNSSTPIVNVQGNNASPSFSRTLGSGDTYFYYGNSSASTGIANISANMATTVSQSGTSGFYGIYNTLSVGQQQVISSNSFSDIVSGSGITSLISLTSSAGTSCYSNMINNIMADGTIYGINGNVGISANQIRQNNIHTLTSNGASAVYPIYVSQGSQAHVSKNKIYDILNTNAGGSAYGIYVAANTTTIALQSDTISNNLVGDIRTPDANAAMPLAGIYISGGTNVHAWFNTVYINASSTGSLFGSAALYASTTPNVELKNNILVNVSDHSGAGITSAYARSSANLATYTSGSDNNLFYAGTTTPGNAIFYNGTTAYSFLSDFKTAVSGHDVVSVTENPPFISTNGSDSDFLDLDQSVATQVESGASPIAVIVDDFGSSTRNTTTPDMGAWENNYTSAGDLLSPTLLATGFTNNSCNTALRTFTATLTDVSGVATGLLAPRVYYKVNTGVYSSATGSLTSGTTLSGTWTFSLTYSAALSDVISYYLVAQDISGIPNVLSAPANGFSGSSVTTIITAPITPFTFTIQPLPVAINSTSVSICVGESASLTATGATTYSWMPGNMTSTTVSVTPNVTTIYTVTGTNAEGCVNTASATVMVNVCTGIQSYSADDMIALYPNPSTGMVSLKMPFEGQKEIMVINALGATVQQLHTTQTNETLDLSSLPKGIYFVKIVNGARPMVSKLIIE